MVSGTDMQHFSFLPPSLKHTQARWWLLVGVAALALAGFFALILVIARTPALAKLPLFLNLFHEALVVHVNLSVLVWFLSIAMMFWSLLADNGTRRPVLTIPYLERAALLSFSGGALLMSASPLSGQGEALMSNYIPVINNVPFFLSLALLLCGIGLMLIHLLLARPKRPPGITLDGVLHFAISGSAITTLVALIAFVWAWRLMPPEIIATQYYDMLFWAGGHILQFTHIQVQMVCWVLLFAALCPKKNLSSRLLFALFAIGPLVVLFSIYPFLAYDIASMEYREFYTQLMIAANGLAPLLLGGFLLTQWKALWQDRQQRALSSALLASLVLFFYGGALGGMIRGQNVVIPAHYHGSIVSVTLALMGIAYMLLPRFGYRHVLHWRLAFWQPIVYGVGQLMHISGLAWSGGYGVLRKTPGALESGFSGAKVAMGFMGLGGLLAIIGGLMFVVVIARATCCYSKVTNV